MMNFLQRHPFAVVARFERVVAVSFAFPEAVLRSLVPAGLEIDGFEGLGFVTVALVWTRSLRPAGFPAFLGQDFFLAGYRIFCRLPDSGRRLRGLQIIRSETDKRLLVWLGNLMTRYRYQHVEVRIDQAGDDTRVLTFGKDDASTLDLTFSTRQGDVALPAGSPFLDWTTARRFAGPMPFTFSSIGGGSFVVVEGSRTDWVPRAVAVKRWHVSLFAEEPFSAASPIVANAFMVDGVSNYRWAKGRVVRAESTV